MRDDRQRLVDILDAIDRIDRHTGGGRAAFERDELVQIWVLRHLQLIGEAALGRGPRPTSRGPLGGDSDRARTRQPGTSPPPRSES
ncbi:MAG: HepT-like ribonuclease domain-containing protein [Microthrixaceae bacterium]